VKARSCEKYLDLMQVEAVEVEVQAKIEKAHIPVQTAY
jgi:hypothetical protein